MIWRSPAKPSHLSRYRRSAPGARAGPSPPGPLPPPPPPPPAPSRRFAPSLPPLRPYARTLSPLPPSAAAYRYTECRMEKIGGELLADIDKETVNFQPNYDDKEQEPVVLPARFPNLLVNGAAGIAVGMATNIPPHNLRETIDATIAVIDNPNITIAQLTKHIKGPDFPTGASIVGRQGIKDAYETGR